MKADQQRVLLWSAVALVMVFHGLLWLTAEIMKKAVWKAFQSDLRVPLLTEWGLGCPVWIPILGFSNLVLAWLYFRKHDDISRGAIAFALIVLPYSLLSLLVVIFLAALPWIPL